MSACGVMWASTTNPVILLFEGCLVCWYAKCAGVSSVLVCLVCLVCWCAKCAGVSSVLSAVMLSVIECPVCYI